MEEKFIAAWAAARAEAEGLGVRMRPVDPAEADRKSTRLNYSHP